MAFIRLRQHAPVSFYALPKAQHATYVCAIHIVNCELGDMQYTIYIKRPYNWRKRASFEPAYAGGCPPAGICGPPHSPHWSRAPFETVLARNNTRPRAA